MPEDTTVEQAIKRGYRTVNLPFLLLLLILITLSILITLNLSFFGFGPFAFILSLVLSVIYRGIRVTKWRVWAFEHVRNVHELKFRAIQARLMLAEEVRMVVRLTERWSAADKERWQQLQAKFQREDLYADDPAVPAETVVCFSRFKKILYLLLFLFCTGVGILFICLPGKNKFSAGAIWGYIWGTLLSSFMGYMVYSTIKDLFNRESQIIVNNEGMQVAGIPFYTWQEIHGEQIVQRGSGKTMRLHLVYYCPAGQADLQLDAFDISRNELARRIRTHRKRADHKLRMVKTGVRDYRLV